MDPNSSMNRVELASVAMDLADPMGKANAVEQLLTGGLESVIMRLVHEDENTNVRLAVINKLVELVHVVGISDEWICKLICEDMIKTLGSDKNWRIRHATLLLLPSMAQELGVAKFTELYVTPSEGGFDSRAQDNTALVRTDWVIVCSQIAQLSGFDAGWLSSHVVPILEKNGKDSKNYQLAAVCCDGLKELAGQLSLENVQALTRTVITLSSDKVVNLRILAVMGLQAGAKRLSKTPCSELDEAKTTLQTLSQETEGCDPDVVWFSAEALKTL
jgi:hypothetical protein